MTCQTCSILLGHNSTALPESKKTVVAVILHAVHEGIQSQMTANIEQLETHPTVPELYMLMKQLCIVYLVGL